MSDVITIDLQGEKEIKALLKSFTDREMQNRIRRGNRAAIRVFRQGIRSLAGSQHGIPRTFRSTRTRNHRNPIGTSVSPKSPLSNIFEHGAKGHRIGSTRSVFLAGPEGPGASGFNRYRPQSFFARGAVSHPGMRPRPFIAPVFKAGEAAATKHWFDTMFDERISVPADGA